MTDFNQKTHDTDVGSHGGQSRQMMEVFENQEFGLYGRSGSVNFSILLLTAFLFSTLSFYISFSLYYKNKKSHCPDVSSEQ